MKTFRFLEFPVYQQSVRWYREVSELLGTHRCPREIHDQLTRAALSVSLNIAEGSAKFSDKEFARFLQISLGSINECVACLNILKFEQIVSETKYSDLFQKAEQLARQLGGFAKSLRSNG